MNNLIDYLRGKLLRKQGKSLESRKVYPAKVNRMYPLLFSVIPSQQISKNLQSNYCHFQTFFKLNSTFTFAFITRGCHS